MDEIETFKKFLGPIAKEYNDAQLLQLRREMRKAADLLLDIYLWRKRGNGKDRKDHLFDDFVSEP